MLALESLVEPFRDLLDIECRTDLCNRLGDISFVLDPKSDGLNLVNEPVAGLASIEDLLPCR